MRLTRLQSRVLAVGILTFFFIISIAVTKSGSSGKRRPSPAPTATAVPNGNETPSGSSNFVLNEFQRSETKDGNKLWEVKARRGQYYPETNTAILEEATVYLHQKDGASIEVRTGAAKLFLSGPSLARIEASEKVVVSYPEKRLSLETDTAVYDKEKDSLFAPGHVVIRGELADIDGDILTAKLAERDFLLEKNVVTVIKPGERK